MTSSSLLDMVVSKSLKPTTLVVGLPTHFKPDPNSNMVSERVWPGFSNSRLSVWMSSPSGPIQKFPVVRLDLQSQRPGFSKISGIPHWKYTI